MAKDKLYLMRPGFMNAGMGPFYCGDSVAVEGMLSFFPELRDKVEIHYVEFPRPRATLVEALGEQHQSIPILILDEESEPQEAGLAIKLAKDKRFIEDQSDIRRYLSGQHDLPHSG